MLCLTRIRLNGASVIIIRLVFKYFILGLVLRALIWLTDGAIE